ncbi:glycosyltransferase family 4 protein [Metabacillus arenae]|uniref:Glycosyltransferase family 4 protein n=1 Tax=Metabacillus arenae TaxID=2771434 RepID=A0A926RVV1_9BACI|nr:glycosyltransferase family 4 protein [Metabacillus arenae]MBD1378890.1 glycosyltransferase family 4 protein [Metabacillus arenae]
MHDSRLRILLLSTEFPPFIEGGLGRHVSDLSRFLSQEGHRVTVLTLHKENKRETEYKHDCRIIRTIPPKEFFKDRIEWSLNVNFAFIQEAVSLNEEFDIIHSHDWLTANAGIYLSKIMNIPLVSTIHATEKGRKGKITSAIEKAIHHLESELITSSSSIIVCSNQMKEEVLNQFSLEPSKLSIIHNGIDPKNFEIPSSAKHILKKYHFQNPYLFTMGRFVEEKGIHYLIEAFAKIHKKWPDLYLIIAGKGPWIENYKTIIEKYHIQKRVIFTGFIDELERNILLQNAIASVYPSYYEPFGIVALESLMMKTPLIVSDKGAWTEWIKDQQNGFIFSYVGSQRLDDTIQFVIKHTDLAKQVGQKGYETVMNDFQWKDLVHTVIAVYKHVLK